MRSTCVPVVNLATGWLSEEASGRRLALRVTVAVWDVARPIPTKAKARRRRNLFIAAYSRKSIWGPCRRGCGASVVKLDSKSKLDYWGNQVDGAVAIRSLRKQRELSPETLCLVSPL